MMAVLLACRLAMPGDSSLKSTPRLLAWTALALEQTSGDAACIAALTGKEQHCAAFKTSYAASNSDESSCAQHSETARGSQVLAEITQLVEYRAEITLDPKP